MSSDNCNKGVCAFHAERDGLITEINSQINDHIGPTINQHKGYWKFFFISIGLALSVMAWLTVDIKQSAETVAIAVVKLEKSLSNQSLRTVYLEKRFDESKAIQTDIRHRIRDLETNH